MNKIFVELEFPDAVSNAFNDVLMKATKEMLKTFMTNPNVPFFDSLDLIEAIIRVF
jgi:hypothetical protein